jgi:hypothetical protein
MINFHRLTNKYMYDLVSSISILRGEVDTLDVNTSGFKSMAIEVTANSNEGSDGDYLYAVIE